MNIHCIGVQDIRLNYIAKFLQKRNNVTCSYPNGTNLKNNCISLSLSEYSKSNITSTINKVIVAADVNADNVEVQEAMAMGIPLVSISTWLRDYADHKQRIVVIGNEAHNVCTLAILALKSFNIQTDYALHFIENMPVVPVHLEDNPIILIEAKATQKSMLNYNVDHLAYEHHIGVICNDENLAIANSKILEDFTKSTPKGGVLFFSKNNEIAKKICANIQVDVKCITFNESTYAMLDFDENYIDILKRRVGANNTVINAHNVGIVGSLLQNNFSISEEEYYESLFCKNISSLYN